MYARVRDFILLSILRVLPLPGSGGEFTILFKQFYSTSGRKGVGIGRIYVKCR
jgi:hypothetical protein